MLIVLILFISKRDLLICIAYDCCNHMRPLVHLKQVKTKKSNLKLQNSFETQKCQNRAWYPFYPVPSDKTTIGYIYYNI